MSPFARSLLALAAAALLHGAYAKYRRSNARSEWDASVSLGNISGSDIVNLPQLHIGIPDVIVTIPNDCDPYGYLHKDLLGSELIVSNSQGGAPPVLSPVDPNDPQSDVEVSCQVEYDEHGEHRCPGGLDVNIYQFCRHRIM